MRSLLKMGLLLLLTACTEATASKIDERTFKIEGPQMASASDATLKRRAEAVCQNKGYYIVDSESHKGGPDRATGSPDDLRPMTVWTIRCIR